jgi:molybdenum cofactor cytidylyltransferase
MRVSGLVLAAGGSRRLGAPKQLLPYGGTTLLGASLAAARRCPFDQLVLTLGASADEIGPTVDLSGVVVVRNEEHATGCSSSIKAALRVIEPEADGLVLLLGDQPEVQPAAVVRLVSEAGQSTLGICRYDDGLGHPLWFHRRVFADLDELHGDKAVWKLIESGRYPVTEVAIPGPLPLDVDTWDDYDALLARTGLEARADMRPVPGKAGP